MENYQLVPQGSSTPKSKETPITRKQANEILYAKIDKLVGIHNDKFDDQRSAGVLKSDVISTCKFLMNIYTANIYRLHKNDALQDGLPSFRTCAPSISKTLPKCVRTIRYHIDKLHDAGILRKFFRGTNASVEIFFNHDLTALYEEITGVKTWYEGSLKKCEIESNKDFFKIYVARFASYSLLNLKLNSSIKEYNAVEKSKNTNRHQEVSDLTLDSHTVDEEILEKREVPDAKISDAEIRKIERINVKKVKFGLKPDPVPNRPVPNPVESSRSKELEHQVLSHSKILLYYAYHLLFKRDGNPSPEKESKLLDKLAPFYKKANTENIGQIHDVLMQMVDQAFRYMSLNPSKTLPDPLYWFDISNQLGFRGTYRWMKRKSAAQRNYEAEKYVNDEIKIYQKEITTGGLSQMEAYRKSEQRISKKFNKFLPLFYAKIGIRNSSKIIKE